MAPHSGVESCDGYCDKKLPVADVSHKSVEPDFQGIGVEFVDVDEAHRRRLDEFISGEAADPADSL